MLVAVWPSPHFIRSSIFCPSLINNNLFVSRAVGHFSLLTLSTYTTLSTLFDWLWMWAVSAARQCVCDLVAVISQGLTHFWVLIRNFCVSFNHFTRHVSFLLEFKIFQKFRCKIAFSELLVLHQFNVKWNGCFNSFNNIFTQCPVHFINGFFSALGNCNEFSNH